MTNLRLATVSGRPFKLYSAVAGEIISADGRRIEFADVPDLICAHASYALSKMALGHKITARRFAREALSLHEAWEEACQWRGCSAPTILQRAKADEADRKVRS